MRVVQAWDVVDPSGIGRVRHEITRILSESTYGTIVDGAERQPTAVGGIADLRNRVALACSELVTNALRHGQLPIQVRLLTDGHAWTLDVIDAATDSLPDPSPRRALGHGGYGLLLVARMASHLGWYVSDDAKHVWARIELSPDADLVDDLGR
jgi:anti-sigma regulatory factor (Ser/Thr protein kinase)